jgi:hypothetical protein
MRRRSVVAIAALIAVLALTGLPVPADSTTPSSVRALEPAAFSSVTVPADAPALAALGASAAGPARPAVLDPGQRSAGHLAPGTALEEPGVEPLVIPTGRPKVDQPAAPSGKDWKKPRYTISGYATFYDNGTTAMRLPRGTVVRICGDGGCIERVVNDYGPQKKARIVDLYRPDFFEICGCSWFAGTTWVTVSVY